MKKVQRKYSLAKVFIIKGIILACVSAYVLYYFEYKYDVHGGGGSMVFFQDSEDMTVYHGAGGGFVEWQRRLKIWETCRSLGKIGGLIGILIALVGAYSLFATKRNGDEKNEKGQTARASERFTVEETASIPVEQYAAQTGLDKDEIIASIKKGELKGFVKDEVWFIDA